MYNYVKIIFGLLALYAVRGDGIYKIQGEKIQLIIGICDDETHIHETVEEMLGNYSREDVNIELRHYESAKQLLKKENMVFMEKNKRNKKRNTLKIALIVFLSILILLTVDILLWAVGILGESSNLIGVGVFNIVIMVVIAAIYWAVETSKR